MKKLITGVAGSVFSFILSAVGHADTPDFMADVMSGDGVGYVDTGYAYKAGVTTRVSCDFHTARRGMGDRPTSTSNVSRSLFGFLHNTSKSISYVRFQGSGDSSSDQLQFWGNSYAVVQTQSLNSQQDFSLAIDYETGKIAYDGKTFTTDLAAPAADSPLTYWVFSANGNSSPTPFDLKEMKIYEKVDSSNVAVRDLKPCFAQGKAALYDSVNAKVYYPTSEGFALSGYDIVLAANQALTVNGNSCSPRTLSLAGDNVLTFDGLHTLHSDATVALPGEGKTTVSLATATGKGRYVLIDTLPADYDLASTFVLGDVPVGFAGVLSKNGSKLILTLSASGFFPEAQADILKGTTNGWVDTGYYYDGKDFPKTSKIVFDFYSTDRCRDGRSGNIARSLFGFLDGNGCLSYARFTGSADAQYDSLQIWGASYASINQTISTISGRMLGDLSFVIDYANGKASYDGGATMLDLAAPTARSTKSIWFCGVNGNNSPAPVEFKEMRIFERDASGVETLVHDFVPAVSGGKSAAYDRVAKTVKLPTSDGFTVQGTKWRLSVNGEVVYATGTVSVAAADVTTAQGWLATADADGRVVARGSGATATFDMPNEPVTVTWAADATVAAGTTLTVSAPLVYNTLTLEDGATLAFSGAGLLSVATDVVLPAGGSVAVTFDGANAPGNHVLVRGVSEGLDLSVPTVSSVPTGCLGVLSRMGDELALTVSRDSSANAAIVANVLKGDGVGYVDTGYFYTYSENVKTSKLEADFYSANRGMGTAEVGVSKTRAVFGYLNNSGSANGSLSYLRFTGNGLDESDTVQMWGNSYAVMSTNVNKLVGLMKGSLSFVVDYANAKGSFFGGDQSFDLARPVKTSPRSIWIMNANGHNYPSAFDFRKMDIYENQGGDDVLVHRYVPALSGDDKAAVYDTVAARVILPTGSGLSVDFGTVTQTFFTVRTVSSGMPVGVPVFGVERDFTFFRDGSVTAKFAMTGMKMTRYDASGTVLGTEEMTAVAAGSTFAVTLAGAAKMVVTVVEPSYPSVKTVGQSFDAVDVLGVAPSSFRRVKKHDCELAIAGPVTLTFRRDVESVFADDYDAAGNLVGTTQVSGAVVSGSTCDVAFGAAVTRILRIAETRPGLTLILR